MILLDDHDGSAVTCCHGRVHGKVSGFGETYTGLASFMALNGNGTVGIGDGCFQG